MSRWPDIRSQSEKCAQLIQIKDIVFPQNTEKTPKRCTKDNFKTVMRNRNAALIQFATDLFYFACKCFVFFVCECFILVMNAGRRGLL